MEDYEVLAPGGHENLINNVTERLDEKAYIDGYYQQLTAGAADNLTGRGDGVSASYLYRTTGGDADVADGTATVKSIHGRTLVWNQAVPAFDDTWTTNAVTTSYDQTTDTVTVTCTSDNNIVKRTSKASAAGIAGHKYYMASTVDASHISVSSNASIGFNSGSSNSGLLGFNKDAVGRASGIVEATADSTAIVLRIPSNTASGDYVTYKDTIIIDLTLMFGAGNEPSTADEFEALYPEPHYPYDAGSLLSVQMEGIETVGFNQWDEEWEVGGINTSTGENNTYTDRIRAKNYIPVISGTRLYIRMASTSSGTPWFAFYDDVKAIIPTPDVDASVSVSNNMVSLQSVSGAFTVPAGAHYMRFYVTAAYGTTYNHDICINLSWSGYRNGEYEPYWKSERTIPSATYFPSGMRGAGSAYDELTSDAAVTRINAMNLGDRTWNAYSSGAGYTYYCNVTGGAPSKASGTSNIICTEHPIGASSTTLADGEMIGGSNNTRIYIRDDSCTTEAAMKTARSGEILYYELETPTTTPIDPPLNLTYRVSDFGTERIMVPANEQSAPPTMQVVYGINAVDTIRRLPQEYISHDSFTQFRIALGAKLGVFIIETWDETDNRYEYTINDA